MKVINREQALAIHAAALEVLETIGVNMKHQDVRRMLLDGGCRAGKDGWVHIPSSLVEDALKSAPRQIALYDQLGNEAMSLVDDNLFYGTGSDATFTLDLETGDRRRSRLQDTANFARLVDGLGNISFAMSMSNPEDAPVDSIYVYSFAEMVKNTNKPIVFIADSARDLAKIHEIACAVTGGEENLRQKPFLLNYSEPISPLRFPAQVMDKLVFCAQKEIPVCLPSGANAGGGAPVTLAGALALGIAENLAALTIHQLTRRGAPFLFGPNVSALDMRTGIISYGCPEWSLTQAALAQMRDEIYGLPVWAFAGATDSKAMDAQAGAESMFSIATSMLSRCNLIHDVGYIEFSNTSCLEMVTMGNELVAMCKFFVQGIPVNEDTLAIDAIRRVGTGESGEIFLSDEHTFKHFRTAQFLPRLLNRSYYDEWVKEGGMDLYKRCNLETKRVLAEHEVRAKPLDVLNSIQKIIEA
jgi:trimethylamine--corrinoid protein Co-methyltransferase